MTPRTAAVLLMIAVPATLAAQTRELLDAQRAQSRIRFKADPSTHQISYAVDDEQVFRLLPAKPLFRVGGSVAITYAGLNPLRVRVTADDGVPSGGVVERSAGGVLDGFASAWAIAIPRLPVSSGALPVAAGACPELDAAIADADLLARSIYGDDTAVTFGAMFKEWRTTVDGALAAGRSGPDAIGPVIDRMKGFARDITRAIDSVRPVVLKLEGRAQDASSGNSCAVAVASMSRATRLTNPRARMQQLLAVAAAVAEFSDALSAQYMEAATGWWQGGDYIVRQATTKTGDAIRIVLAIDAADSEETNTRTSATIELRRTSRFVREFGVGTTVSSIVRPKYGTSSNVQGQTVVARLPPGKVSFAPVVVANLTCLCDTGPFVTPMLQAGLSTSPDAPGLLAGGGLRLFGAGTGDIALGGGWITAWTQDLKTLRIGDRVGGTIDIDRDFGFTRRNGWYLLAQYKF